MNSTNLCYTLRCDEWSGLVAPWDVAVSKSMPDSILIICSDQPYVYELPKQESSTVGNKYAIQGADSYLPLSICTNATTAVMAIWCREDLVVCSWPRFNQQRLVNIGWRPFDLQITSDYLLVMGLKRVLVKRVMGANRDRCLIEPPSGCKFRAISFRNNAKHVYIGCYHEGNRKGCVYKYTRDDKGDTPEYINDGCVIDNLPGDMAYRGMTVTDDGLLAVSITDDSTRIYSLEY